MIALRQSRMNRSDLSELALLELEAVHRLAHPCCAPGRGDVDELVQETYATALRMSDRLLFEGKTVRLWLFGVFYAILRRREAAENVEAIALVGDRDSSVAPDAASTILHWYNLSPADWTRVDRWLRLAIDELPLTLRIVFLLWSCEGLSTRQLSAVVEAEEPHVRARLQRATMAIVTQLGEVAPSWIAEPAAAVTD